ncbi:hypothetical protein HY572_04595 [Candidatus Micrarchaeota archaeon]|nr:hypothetical protein [Candidatus Micrarchaeota archaeon]
MAGWRLKFHELDGRGQDWHARFYEQLLRQDPEAHAALVGPLKPVLSYQLTQGNVSKAVGYAVTLHRLNEALGTAVRLEDMQSHISTGSSRFIPQFEMKSGVMVPEEIRVKLKIAPRRQ